MFHISLEGLDFIFPCISGLHLSYQCYLICPKTLSVGGGGLLLASLFLILVTAVLILFVASSFANHELVRRLDERKP
jgi:hypothetical protein